MKCKMYIAVQGCTKKLKKNNNDKVPIIKNIVL